MSYADGLLSTGERIIAPRTSSTGSSSSGALAARSWPRSSRAVLLVALAEHGDGRRQRDAQRRSSAGRRRSCSSAASRPRLDGAALPQPGVRPDEPSGHPGRGRPQQALDRQLAREDQRRGADQSVFGRIFGFGDLDRPDRRRRPASTGSGCCASPIVFKQAMLDAKHEYEVDMERAGWHARPADPRHAAAPPRRGRRDVARRRPPSGAPTGAPAHAPAAAPAAARESTRTRSRARWRASPTCATVARSRAEEYEAKKADLLGRL